MKLISLLLLLPNLCFGSVMKKEASYILPLKLVNYPMEKFIRDYADLMNKTIFSNEIDLPSNRNKINITINEKINVQDFSKMFYTILESRGYTALAEGDFLMIFSSRDIRYSPTKLYDSDDFPKTDAYVFVLHQLKNPLANEITRNLRPFLSRYGRVIDFSDAHSIGIQDRGANIDRLISIINSLDNQKSFDRLKNKKSFSLTKKKHKKTTQEEKEQMELEILKLKRMKLEMDLTSGGAHSSRRKK